MKKSEEKEIIEALNVEIDKLKEEHRKNGIEFCDDDEMPDYDYLRALSNQQKGIEKAIAIIKSIVKPTEPIIEPIAEGYVKKYGWDGKPMIVKDESEEDKITVEYIVANQSKKKQERVLVDIFRYMEDLMWAGKFDVVDDFIKEFCEQEICFQYCLCLLTAACWASNKINSMEILIEKTKKKGIEEIGEEDTNSCLKGLI
jgi:hypothetical protein